MIFGSFLWIFGLIWALGQPRRHLFNVKNSKKVHHVFRESTHDANKRMDFGEFLPILGPWCCPEVICATLWTWWQQKHSPMPPKKWILGNFLAIWGQIWILVARQTPSVQCCHYKKVSFGCPHMEIKSLADANKFISTFLRQFCPILGPWGCPEVM